MLETVGGAVAESVTRRLGGHAVAGAVVFWTVGGLWYLLNGSRVPGCPGGDSVVGRLTCPVAANPTLSSVVVAVLAASVVVSSSAVVAAAAPRLVHTMAGSGWAMTAPGAWIAERRRAAQQQRRNRLAELQAGDHTWQRVSREARLRSWPKGRDARIAPTRLGNVFAAAAQRVANRHGLNLGVCWEAQVAVLPEIARSALVEQSTIVQSRVQHMVWTAAAALWAPLVPTGVGPVVWITLCTGLTWVIYVGVCHACQAYGDMVEGIVATHRMALYRALGFAAPVSLAAERQLGALVSRLLGGGAGVAAEHVRFVDCTRPMDT